MESNIEAAPLLDVQLHSPSPTDTNVGSAPVVRNDAVIKPVGDGDHPDAVPTNVSTSRLFFLVKWLSFLVFGVLLFYASGLFFPILSVVNQAGALPSADSALWHVVFPLQSFLNPDAISKAVATRGENGTADLTHLPFFAEAAPFFLLAVICEVYICVYIIGRKYYRLNDAISSLSIGLISQVGGAAFAISMTPAYQWIYEHWSVSGIDVTSVWSWYVGFLLVDFGYYWFHRASHVLGWLWASHSVHHSSEEYNLTTALRQNLIDGIFGFVVYLPCAFFVPLSLASSHLTFNLLWQFYLHTRVIKRLGPVEWIFNTPSHHRVHHGRNPRAIDKNFASIFIIWDRMFGTFQAEDELLYFGVIPPLQSFSPIYANLIGWKDILDKVRDTPGILNKLSMIVCGPGWRYSKKEERCKHAPVPAIGHRMNPRHSFNPPLPHPWITAYAIAQFVCLAVVYFYFPDVWDNLAVAAVGAVLSAAGLHVVMALLSGDPWGPYLEMLRALAVVVALSVLLGVMPEGLQPVWLYYTAAGVYAGLAVIGFIAFSVYLIRHPDVRVAAAEKWHVMTSCKR